MSHLTSITQIQQNMDAKADTQKTDLEINSRDSDNRQINPTIDSLHDSRVTKTSDNDDINLRVDRNAHYDRNDSFATAVEDQPYPTETGLMDKIETAPVTDRTESQEHTSNLADTVQRATHGVKKKLYLHHRNQRALSKEFTAGSVFKHLPFTEHNASNQQKTHKDTEAQTDTNEIQSPTVWQNFRVMFTTFPYWNMAFWSGWCYSIGSAMFVISGAWAWVPYVWPETEFEGQSEYGVPLWFFFGACLYQIGGVMAYLEAVNDGSFAGAAMKKLLKGHEDIEKEFLDAKLHTFFGHIVPHHHDDDSDENNNHRHESTDPDSGWKSLDKNDSPEEVYAETKERVERRGGVDHGEMEKGEVREYLTWRWWPTWHGLRTYHIFELGYVACAIQLFGVTLFGVTSIVVFPGILDSLEWWQELAAYWIPQVVASCCFLIASVMFTVMAQDTWYKPKINAVSWWIGIWAQVGSVGFLLCAVFGLYSHAHTWGEYQSSLSSTWGSFFYMLSGLFQWYEAINVNVGPVLAFPNNRTPVLLRHNRS